MSLRDLANNLFNKGKQTVNPILESLNNFKDDLPANSAYLQNRIAQAVSPKYQLPTANEIANEQYNPLDPQLYDGRTKSMSAQIRPMTVAPDTPQARMFEQQKQEVLNSGNYRPAMKRYLSTIPIYTSNPNGEYGGMALTGRSSPPDTPWEQSSGPMYSTIEMPISQTADLERMKENPFSKKVMAHELAHTSPRQNKYQADFVKLFESITPESNPKLYDVSLKYYNNGEPAPNPEEFYATMAAEMGPEVLNDPEVARFFEHMFNKPEPTKPRTGTWIKGTSVPNSGGGKVGGLR